MMNIWQLVVSDGDLVRGTGRVIQQDFTMYMEPRVSAPSTPPQEPARVLPPSRHAVPVDGSHLVDLLSSDRSGSNRKEAWLTVVGEWRDGRLREAAAVTFEAIDDWWSPQPRVDPPCPRPRGGWPALSRIDLDDAQPALTPLIQSGLVVSAKAMAADPSGVVMVVAATEPSLVEAVLRPAYGAGLCVVRSRWSRREFDAVSKQIQDHLVDWGTYLEGLRINRYGLVEHFVAVRHVTSSLAAWAEPLAPGVVTIKSWLRPAETR